jgi:hypothetical protein
MNRSLIEFFEHEYGFVPYDGVTFTVDQLEQLLLDMIADTTTTFMQNATARLEPYVNFGTLAIEIENAATETLDYYNGEDV